MKRPMLSEECPHAPPDSLSRLWGRVGEGAAAARQMTAHEARRAVAYSFIRATVAHSSNTLK